MWITKDCLFFVAYRLIVLDKCPRVQPIGINKTVRRIAIAITISEDIQVTAGPLQVCAGHLAVCEAAVHAMHHFYESIEKGTVILIDASNAFNSLNRQTTLRNIHHLCPSLSKVHVNTYREDIQLFIDRETLLSQEGTTQSDPLAMAMYMPSRSLHSCTVLRMKKPSKSGLRMMLQQVEALLGSRHGGIASSILDLKRFQYLAHSFKEETLEEATTMFEGTGVAITAEGRRHLGAAIGTHSLLKDTSNRRFLHGHIKLIACPPSL